MSVGDKVKEYHKQILCGIGLAIGVVGVIITALIIIDVIPLNFMNSYATLIPTTLGFIVSFVMALVSIINIGPEPVHKLD